MLQTIKRFDIRVFKQHCFVEFSLTAGLTVVRVTVSVALLQNEARQAIEAKQANSSWNPCFLNANCVWHFRSEMTPFDTKYFILFEDVKRVGTGESAALNRFCSWNVSVWTKPNVGHVAVPHQYYCSVSACILPSFFVVKKRGTNRKWNWYSEEFFCNCG